MDSLFFYCKQRLAGVNNRMQEFLKRISSVHRRLMLLFLDFAFIFCVTVFFAGPLSSVIHLRTSALIYVAIAMAGCLLIMRALFGAYRSVWRYAIGIDYLHLIVSDFFGGILFLLMDYTAMPRIGVLRTVAIVTLSLITSLSIRMFYQKLYSNSLQTSPTGTRSRQIRVAIIGAGHVGSLLAQELSHSTRYLPICFIDTDPTKIGQRVSNLPIYKEREDLASQLQAHAIQEAILALPSLSTERRNAVIKKYRETGIKVKIYDYPFESSSLPIGENKKRSVRDIKIEDLLFRKEILLGDHAVSTYTNKTVLVSGAGGSIGSELSRHIASIKPKKLILLDNYENNVYDLQQELILAYEGKLSLTVEIATVRDRNRIFEVFKAHKPDVIFHAAAHKHVPLMESNPSEAVKNNVFGTLNMVDAAEAFAVERFILISTDKAVNPTNVMGATKRLCEMIIQSRVDSATKFVAVRFGNVLGSNGSVIPLFKRQIEAGGPITITDKRIIRYFMTIPEAMQLVIEAGAMAKNNEIYVLDMGSPIKILDLAENLIKLAGLKPGVDIQIKEIGLRPGEKLYEELLINTDTMQKTENQLIFIENMDLLSRETVSKKLDYLTNALNTSDESELICALRHVVPTFYTQAQLNDMHIPT